MDYTNAEIPTPAYIILSCGCLRRLHAPYGACMYLCPKHSRGITYLDERSDEELSTADISNIPL